MSLDLWEQSTEDVRERWRDIARTLRENGDAEALPRALQTAFWFGVEATQRAAGTPRFETTLRGLLPAERIAELRGSAHGPGGPAPRPGSATPPTRPDGPKARRS